MQPFNWSWNYRSMLQWKGYIKRNSKKNMHIKRERIRKRLKESWKKISKILGYWHQTKFESTVYRSIYNTEWNRTDGTGSFIEKEN